MGLFLDPDRVRLGRIRRLTEAAECLRKGQNLPKPLCYVPNTLTFKLPDVKESVPILEEDTKILHKLPEGKTSRVISKGQPLFNKSGDICSTTFSHGLFLVCFLYSQK